MAKKQPRKKNAKKKRAPELSPAELQELDIIVDRLRVQAPAGQSLANCLQTLRPALKNRPAMVASLLERLSKESTAVTYQAYQALRDLVSGTLYERVLRQADYRFRQRGFGADTETAEESRPDKVVLVQSETRPATGYLLSVMGEAWFVAALVPGSYGNSTAVSMILDFAWRCAELKILDGPPKQFKELLRHMAEEQGGNFHEVPVWHVAGLFFESLDRHPKLRSMADFGRSNLLLKPYLKADRRPYPYDVLPSLEDPVAAIAGVDLAAVMDAIGSPGLHVLLVEKSVLAPYWEKIRSVDESILVVPPELKREQTETIMREATDAAFSADAIRYQRRFLEEQALFCHLEKRQSLARDLWAIAQHLRRIETPGESLYLRRLVSGSLYFHWNKEFTEAKPDEPAEPESLEADGLRRSESGLILP